MLEALLFVKMLCITSVCISTYDGRTLHITFCDANAVDNKTIASRRYYTDSTGRKVIYINRSKCDVI